MQKEGCIFCGIVGGYIPGDIILRTERAIAIRDVNPQAPLHFLIIPREHIENTMELYSEKMITLGDIFQLISSLANSYGVDERGYRVVMNVGEDGGQTVDHLHFHFLAGRRMYWPPG
ncbi:MAG: HIT domain-containing protein [bacterium]